MDLADAFRSECADLAVDVEALAGRVARVVEHAHGFRFRAFQNADVVVGADGVFDAENDLGLFRFRADFGEDVGDGFLLVFALDRAFAEEGEEHYFDSKSGGGGNAFAEPLLPEFVVLEVVDVEDVEAGADDGEVEFL